jgi:hypothetical protein
MLNIDDLKKLRQIVIQDLKTNNKVNYQDNVFINELLGLLDIEEKLHTMIRDMEESNGNNR